MLSHNCRVLLCSFLLLASLLSACSKDDVQIDSLTGDPANGMRENRQLLSATYARFRKAQISNPAYHLALDLEAASEKFSGNVTLTFDLAVNNKAPVTLDFDSGTIVSMTVNGRELKHNYVHWFITIPPAALVAGNNTVTIAYERPFATDGAGLHKFIDPELTTDSTLGEEYFYTNFEPYNANRLFPHFDQPDLKAPLTLEVTVPSSWHVIANTMESEIRTEGVRNHWLFPATAPLSSYVYAMHTGPYTVWESNAGGIPLRLFARRALAPFVNSEEWFVPAQQSFAFYQDYFEVAYPFGKYDQIIVPDFNAGAMENVGAVTYNERYISRGEKSTAQLRSLASVIAHEMAHMWFGDLVTMDWWNGLWLNESFATYMANLELERASSFSNVWDSYYTGNKLWAYDTDQLVTTHPIELAVPTTADAFTNFDGITYGKGGSVLKQLPYLIGEENFRTGVSNYLMNNAYSNTTLDDFVSELAAASGINLDNWKQEWLYRSGVNTLQADFTCDNNTLSSLRLLQSVPAVSTANKDLRTQRTQIGLYQYNGQEMLLTAAIPVTYSGAVTWISAAAGQPCPDLVLPNEGDWAYMKINLDTRSFATLNEHINDFSNPTTRIMLWQSLWDSVVDGNLTLAQYLQFALANIGAEKDDNVARLVADVLQGSFSWLSRFGDHAQEKGQIEEFMFTQLMQSLPGSDLQKIWYDSFIRTAHTNQALSYLEALLDGSLNFSGLQIDQDKRWDLIVALNRYQFDDYEELVAAELAQDPSDQGNNMALVAEAIRPQAAIKARWFETIMAQPENIKLATLRTLMANLFPSEQLALLEPFREAILSAIPLLDTTATQGFLEAFTESFDAANCTPQSVARLAQANTDFAGLQPQIVKTYLIHQQQDALCVNLKSALE